jgi:hypothetical protein
MSLRLLKLVIRPVFVEDDGGTLTERVVNPIEVSATEWPQFPETLEKQRRQLEGELEKPAPDSLDGFPPEP